MQIVKNRDRLLHCLKRTAIFIAACILFGNRAAAQYYDFKHYNIENGLIQSQVMKIYQDQNDYLWVATQSGVSRFNGIDFVNYSKVNGLKGDMVGAVLQKNSQVWLRTNLGISLLAAGKIQNYPTSGVSFLRAKNFVNDHAGNIWYIDHSMLFELSDGKSKMVSVTKSTTERIQSLTITNAGDLCVSVHQNGIFCNSGNTFNKIISFDGAFKNIEITKILIDRSDSQKYYLLTPEKLCVAANGIISYYRNRMLDTVKGNLFALEQDKQGHLWVGGSRGAYYLRDNAPIHFTGQNGFTDNVVNDIYKDHQDNIWLGTNGDGFYKFQGFNFESFNKINDFPLQMVMAIGKDDSDNIWLGTDGNGLISFKKNSSKRVYVPSPDPLTRYIVCLANKKNQPMLVGTYGGLWTLDNHNKFLQVSQSKSFPKDINTVIYDSRNAIWVGTGAACYYLEKDKPIAKLLNKPVSTLAEIGKDSVLVGTFDGVTLIRNKTVDTTFKISQLSGYTIMSLVRYKNIVVGGTAGNGLFVFDILNQTCRKYNTLSGILPSNDIYSLVVDKDGVFWAGTGKGIIKFKVDRHFLELIMNNDVVPNPVLEYDQNAILSFDDKIWAGSTKGLFIFGNQQTNADLHETKPVVNIESIKIIDQSENRNKDYENTPFGNIPNKLVLKYKREHIIISYKGIFFSDPENLFYQYRLTGFDKTFGPPSKLNYVEYSALPPGKYTFEIKVIASNGQSSELKYIQIEITPGFFQSVYFYGLIFLAVIGFGALLQYFISYRKNKQRLLLESVKAQEQIRIRKQTAEDFHDDIGNKLTRIVILADILNRKSLKQSSEQKQIVNQIRENANRLFSGAKDILWALDPHSDNLFEVLDHIKYFAIDVFNNTEVNVVFNDFEVEKNLILPVEYSRNISMIFKEVLYNILKHSDATKIVLSSITDEENIKLVVSDNGRGFELNSEKKGKGLINMKTRAKRINSVFEINTIEGTGTSISLTINRSRLQTKYLQQ